MDIQDKRIIVTGGAGGIGACTIRRLLEKKAIVAAVDINEEGLNQLKRACGTFIENLVTYCGDINDFKFVEITTEDFFSHWGRIDALVNNAAILKDAPLISLFKGEIRKYPLKDWDQTIATNLSSVFYFSREVAEKMVLKRTRGVIINVSSISSAGNLGQTAYAAAKAGVNALTVTWSLELAYFGIRVAGVAPGMVDTNMPRNSMNDKTLSDWIKKTPMQRMGHPDEIAKAILFILDNDFFCGRMLEVDGGLRM